MKETLPPTEKLIKANAEDSLLESHNYWLKKRIHFNIIVGIAGVLATIFFALTFSFFDLLGIIMWGFVANGLYSFGYVLESYVITKHPGLNFKKIREFLFWIGTFLYAAGSFMFAYDYYLSL